MGRRLPDPHRRHFCDPVIAALLVACGIAYNMLAIVGAIRFRRGNVVPEFHPPVSILKPVRGLDEHFYEAIRSHAMQQYPQFELIFGTADPKDPARTEIERLRAEYPAVPIRIVDTANDAPNGKVGSLEILARMASHPLLLVNDGDILVPPDYLKRVIGPLADPRVGLVTCLYRARASSIASRAEALGIATEFAPSVLVARLLSTSGFALGATMAFRAEGLEAVGGFAAIRDYLADDYQLGARIAARGKRVALADVVVETSLGAGSWKQVWKHQIRWSRTIRISRPAGYAGYILTQLTFWCVLAAAFGYWRIALAGLIVRWISALVGMRALGCTDMSIAAIVPLRDLFGLAVWAAGIVGREVEWRGLRFRLLPGGRIAPL